jgi:hypothetical protein
LNILVRNSGVNVTAAIVRVTSPCGVLYARSTAGTGLIDDPGFPYGPLTVCVSNSAGTRHRVAAAANTNYAGTDVTYDIGTSGSGSGACPA